MLGGELGPWKRNRCENVGNGSFFDVLVARSAVSDSHFSGTEAMSKGEKVGRREFITMSAAATVFALDQIGGSVAVAATPVAATTINLKTATSATFKALIGQSFAVSGTRQKLVLDRVEVTADPNKNQRPKGIRQESFLLLFSAPANTVLPQGTYTFTTPKQAKFSVWMSKAGTTSMLSTNSALGQAELYLSSVVARASNAPARVIYQVPFS
jgi:hypothetical protein